MHTHSASGLVTWWIICRPPSALHERVSCALRGGFSTRMRRKTYPSFKPEQRSFSLHRQIMAVFSRAAYLSSACDNNSGHNRHLRWERRCLQGRFQCLSNPLSLINFYSFHSFRFGVERVRGESYGTNWILASTQRTWNSIWALCNHHQASSSLATFGRWTTDATGNNTVAAFSETAIISLGERTLTSAVNNPGRINIDSARYFIVPVRTFGAPSAEYCFTRQNGRALRLKNTRDTRDSERSFSSRNLNTAFADLEVASQMWKAIGGERIVSRKAPAPRLNGGGLLF